MAHSSSSWLGETRALDGLGELSTGCGTRSALEMQRSLWSFQWALWQSLQQYLTRPQRAQLGMVGFCCPQLPQTTVSSLEEGFFFTGMALGGLRLSLRSFAIRSSR